MKKENTSLRLNEIMKERGLRQVDILDLVKPFCKEYDVKMNKSDLSQYVSGKVEPSQEKLVILGMALNVNEAWLMGFNVPKERISISNDLVVSEFKIIEKYRFVTKHSPDGAKVVDTVLDREYNIAKQLKQSTSAPAAKPPLRLIQYYQRLASAGTGQYVFDSIPTEQIEIPDIPEYRKVQFALGVNGLSMEPLYSHGDILLIEPTQEVQPGEIGIFLHNGESFVKKLGDGVLHSLNDLYDDIELTEDTRCIGRVIDKLDAPISVSEELGKKLLALAKKTAEKHA